MSLSYSEVGEILKMIESSSCSEVILELDGVKMIVRKGVGTTVAQTPQNSPPVPPITAPLLMTDGVNDTIPKSAASIVEKTSTSSNDEKIVRSPMVGTFYRRSSPEAEPFVVVGQTVKKGETLCLLEVMKLFTAVECERDSVISSIFVEDGELVEFNQALFSTDLMT